MPDKKSRGSILWAVSLSCIVLTIALLAAFYGLQPGFFRTPEPTQPSEQMSSLPSQPCEAPTVPTKPPVTKVGTATIGSTGDLLMHNRVIKSGYDPITGTYNYDSIFTTFAQFVSKMDYAVANLEVTLCGDDNGYSYSGYPLFNSPDQIVDTVKNAGFDMLLTANNHSYDTGYAGFIRTQQIVADRGLAHIGTRLNVEDKNYAVQEINGIRVGMICYTYNTGADENGNVSLNLHKLNDEASRLVNSFCPWELQPFYERLARDIANMRADGAEAIMLYIHWGEEYQTTPNSAQKEMAQALCDMGIDVIVGNHAHVVQPVELLTNSRDESKKTLCLYSMGNALSNIRQSTTHPANCEDGLLFQVTFAKYSDGTVLVESAEVLPTWVHRYTEDGISKFHILAMDGENPEKWQEDMGLSESLLEKCKASYQRTREIVAEGLKAANEYFAQNQTETEKKIGILK